MATRMDADYMDLLESFDDPRTAALTLQEILDHAQELATVAGLKEVAFLIGIAGMANQEAREKTLAYQPTVAVPRTLN